MLVIHQKLCPFEYEAIEGKSVIFRNKKLPDLWLYYYTSASMAL